ncbi:protein of unknown function DUF1697 [Candidatus Koribacter versatilis Ellin345]|uniref:DUF1697 domain-containing protein n=1 Tax=Koribacter versatilis (strain Ellin345) TaxID=204669 RepID=Q1IUC9_KORVE|nr:DUF1697 domain-containing protein [Candidatus Koribacter versatilis]ABF39521.1 protein of unknown function DUF1697 [Candidatus Koribacter versatilis Ellin345]
MPVYICLLRGVNVTGYNKIKMEELRALCTKLKFEGAQTFIQSGNVIFRCPETNEAALAKKIGDAIEKKFGFRPEIMLRTADELRAVVAANPFKKRKDVPPDRMLVHFLLSEPLEEVRTKLNGTEKIEEVHFKGREIYIYFPDGIGRSDLRSVLDRTLKKTATARNFNSVMKILEIAETLESGTN